MQVIRVYTSQNGKKKSLNYQIKVVITVFNFYSMAEMSFYRNGCKLNKPGQLFSLIKFSPLKAFTDHVLHCLLLSGPGFSSGFLRLYSGVVRQPLR